MKVSVLATGSKGNSTYIETKAKKILVDLGTTSIYVERNLKDIGIDPNDIDGIFITHTHVDHVSGLRVFLKKHPTKLYLTKIMLDEIQKTFPVSDYELIDRNINLGDLQVEVIKTSHDVEDSNAYIFSDSKSNLVYITDTGYINARYHNKIKNKNMYIIESNHDVEMLMNGRYPFHLKQRILGDRGHLSNKQCAYYLSKLIGDNTKYIILIHLSEDNNNKEIAYNETKEQLCNSGVEIPKIIISSQKERTEIIKL